MIEALYELRPRDDQVTPLDLVHQFTEFSTNLSSGNVNLEVPRGRVFLLYSAFLFASSSVTGAISLSIRLASKEPPFTAFPIFSVITSDNRTTFLPGAPIPIPSQFLIQHRAEFPGAGTNYLALSVTGILVPQGNFSLGTLIVPP